jgi:hypothetical protein
MLSLKGSGWFKFVTVGEGRPSLRFSPQDRAFSSKVRDARAKPGDDDRESMPFSPSVGRSAGIGGAAGRAMS